MTGTFDVANYGDLLFPLVAAERLRERGFDVVPVSPTEMRPDYADAMAPISADRMLGDPELDPCGVLVGGGYILMTQPAVGLQAYETAGVARTAYPSLWIGAALAAAVRDVPLVWNAPGAPFPFASRRRNETIFPALSACDYASVRDARSASLFAGSGSAVAVAPDTALDLARVWPRGSLETLHRATLARSGLAPETRTLSVHVRARALGAPGEVAALIDSLAMRHGLYPRLLVLGRELFDHRVAQKISSEMTVPHEVVDSATSLRELASAIAGSSLYVGGSFHGYVTAAAYGVSGVMVAVPAHGKFKGLLDQLGRPRDLARDWRAALARAEEHLANPRDEATPASVHEALDAHWDSIVAALGDRNRGRARRMAFLRGYLRAGAKALGSPWLIAPHLSGMPSEARP